jgi:hypothetical protein
MTFVILAESQCDEMNNEPLIYQIEPKTTERMQDEPWYSDYQMVCEIMCAGPEPMEDRPTFYERLPDGLERALAACKQRFRDMPGPPGWTPPDDDRLIRWIKSGWFSEETMAKIEAMYEEEQREHQRQNSPVSS